MTRKKTFAKRCENETCPSPRFKTIYPRKKFCRRNCRNIQNARLAARLLRELREFREIHERESVNA